MATIAMIWELGSDYGHIGRFLPMALALRERGHRPVMLLRDISRAGALLSPHGLEYLQAPLWLPPVNGLPPPANFTETLFRFGFFNPDGLLSVARAWRQLWALLKPDLLLFDHAPTALLAARGLGIPRLITGNSFAVPPRTNPLPPYHWWQVAPAAARLADTEARLVAISNQVLAALKSPQLTEVGDLYDAEATCITGSPQLDVYLQRPASAYVGAINTIDHGETPRWPGKRDKKVFAYLKAHAAMFELALKTLARADASVLVFAQGISRQQMHKFESSNLAFSERPLMMRMVREQCSVAVCHAGGMVNVMLNAGVPVLLLPLQTEQHMTSKRVEQLGCGLVYLPDFPPTMLEKQLGRLLNEPSFRERAAGYAQTEAGRNQETAVTRVVFECERLLAA